MHKSIPAVAALLIVHAGASEPSTNGAAEGQPDTSRQGSALHTGNFGTLRPLVVSGEWTAANAHSTLSTVSSTSMEVLLSAAADFGSGLLDTGGSLRERDAQVRQHTLPEGIAVPCA